jgi:hypothetical protein
MKFHSIDITSTPKQIEKQWIKCEHCGIEEEVTNCPPLIRLERIEYHRRASCVKNDLGLDPEWIKKWRGE